MTIRVLHLRATNFFGGPEKQILEHALHCRSSDVECVIGSFGGVGEHNDLIERARTAGVEAMLIEQSGPADVRMLRRVADSVRRRSIDIVAAHGYKPAVIMACLRGRLGVPIIGFSRGRTQEGWKVGLYQWLEESAYLRFDAIVAVSNSEALRLRSSRVATKRIECVPNAVRIPCAGNDENQPDGMPSTHRGRRLLSAGRLSEEKGHAFLLRALATPKLRELDWHLVVCGTGPLKASLEHEAEESGLSEKVTFAGFREDISSILDWSDIVILPSLSEGLPNIVLEAMAHRRIVVSTAVGGVPDLIEHGRSGFLVAPGDPGRLAGAIVAALGAADERGTMGERARQHVRQEYSFEAQGEELRSIYRSLLVSHATP